MEAPPVTPDLDTPRLCLRALTLGDAPAVQAQFPRWEVVRLLASRVPWPYPDDGALTYIRDVALPGMQRGEEWHWSIRPLSAPDQLIGLISLMTRPDENRGFWLAPEWQGQGLMTEASEAVTAFWFEDLGQPMLRVPKAVANAGSRGISLRQRMRVVWTGESDYVSGPAETELWEITAAEWRDRKTARA